MTEEKLTIFVHKFTAVTEVLTWLNTSQQQIAEPLARRPAKPTFVDNSFGGLRVGAQVVKINNHVGSRRIQGTVNAFRDMTVDSSTRELNIRNHDDDYGNR